MKRDTRVSIKNNLFPIKLDIGCKKNTKPGFVGLDARDFGQEILWNIDNGIPLPDNSVSEVYSDQFFEHLTDFQINLVCWELQRVCINGAKVFTSVPPGDSDVAFDVAHYSRWTEQRFRGLFNSMGNKILRIERDGGNLICEIEIVK